MQRAFSTCELKAHNSVPDKTKPMRLRTLASLLVIPLAFLLFAQWPLREWVQAYTRQANDMAQLIFAVYMALAVYAASRTNTHIALEPNQAPRDKSQGHWKIYLQWLCVVPWAAFMLWSWRDDVLRSALGLERFPDSNLPAYFIIKIALLLMLLLLAAHYSGRAWRALSDRS